MAHPPHGAAVLRADKTAAIRRAVFEELASHGWAGVTVEAIAARARVGCEGDETPETIPFYAAHGDYQALPHTGPVDLDPAQLSEQLDWPSTQASSRRALHGGGPPQGDQSNRSDRESNYQMPRNSRRGWQADVHWRAVNGAMDHATVTLDTLPEPFGVFAHPDVADGHRMQITALSIDQRRHQLRLDLTAGPPRRAASPSSPETRPRST